MANFVLSLLFITTAILFWCIAAQQSHPSAVKGVGWFGFFVGCLSIYAGAAVFFIETYGRVRVLADLLTCSVSPTLIEGGVHRPTPALL